MAKSIFSMMFNGFEQRFRHSFVAHSLAVLFILFLILVFGLAYRQVVTDKEKLSSLTMLLVGIISPLIAPVTTYLYKKAGIEKEPAKTIPFKIELKTAIDGREISISVDPNSDPDLVAFVKDLILKPQCAPRPIKTE
jgi:hypothetical protein